MGTGESKLAAKVPNDTVEEKGSIPSTPILTMKNFNYEISEYERDPRSPSRTIARTPIQLLTEAAAKLEKFQTDDNIPADTETPIKQPIFLRIDPRSPTTDFERTPIVINTSSDSNVPHKIHNKILDKVRKSAILGTPKTNTKKPIAPKLLESSPITTKHLDNKRKSYVGLLETNIDYTETNLDTVIKEKELMLSKSLPVDDSVSNDVIGIVNDDPRSPTTDFIRTPIQVFKKLEEINHHESTDVFPVEDENNVQSRVNIENTDTSLPEELNIDNEEIEICKMKEVVNTSFEDNNDAVPIVESSFSEFENQNIGGDLHQDPSLKYRVSKSAPITPTSTNTPVLYLPRSEPVSPPLIDLTADIKELDKKLSNLIYEDNSDLVVCPRVVKLKEQSRTPLGDRNSSVQNKTAPQPKLKVSDKPRKLEYGVSKIPLYKDKIKKHSRKVQCENTPPSNMMVKSKNKSLWDNDSLII